MNTLYLTCLIWAISGLKRVFPKYEYKYTTLRKTMPVWGDLGAKKGILGLLIKNNQKI